MKLPDTVDDLNALIRNEVQESLHLDYKDSRAIDHKKRHEIAKDVSAFANSDGGILIYGIKEEGHLPKILDKGVEHDKYSREWIEEVILSNVNPKIENLKIVQIPFDDRFSAFAIEIPKSYRAPHQEQSSKRYYKRYNFKSQPMEDYEIKDIAGRAIAVSPLINVDISIRHGVMVYLEISNIGTLPAENVIFRFSEEMTWRSNESIPSLIDKGSKYFPPNRKYQIFYNTFQEIFSEKNTINSTFDVTTIYFHPQIRERISDTFHIDLMDYYHTSVNESEAYEQGKKIEKSINDLSSNMKKLSDLLKDISSISGPTGLDLSITTLRNLKHILKNTETYEKINPLYCSHEIFQEVLGVDATTAFNIRNHFWGENKIESISEINGMTEEKIELFKKHFRTDDT